MIRIHTKVGDKRVKTLFISGKWVTLASGQAPQDSNSLLEAGQLHIRMAHELQKETKRSEEDISQSSGDVTE